MKKIIFILLIIITFCFSIKSQEIYISNFSHLGFFITIVELNQDSTFKYNLRGDLINDNFTGKYKIIKNNLYLQINENEIEEYYGISLLQDSSFMQDSLSFYVDSLLMRDMIYLIQNSPYKLKNENGIDYNIKFKINKDKLYEYHFYNGKILKYGRYYTGKKWKNKKRYLKIYKK